MKHNHKKNEWEHNCRKCLVRLDIESDHIGGGSHYYELICPKCKMRYLFDTYWFFLGTEKNFYKELEEYQFKKDCDDCTI